MISISYQINYKKSKEYLRLDALQEQDQVLSFLLVLANLLGSLHCSRSETHNIHLDHLSLRTLDRYHGSWA